MVSGIQKNIKVTNISSHYQRQFNEVEKILIDLIIFKYQLQTTYKYSSQVSTIARCFLITRLYEK